MQNDRAVVQLDQDVQAVLEFMQSKIQASKLVAVAESLPQIARLLWSQYPQESVSPFGLFRTLPHPSSISCAKPLDAIESSLPDCAGYDSAKVERALEQ